jgi:molecular chaperone HtpG
MTTQTKPFKTEVRQLLDLVIHSLYSKKEIFLRELVSNASDAIDRARFEALTDTSILSDGETFQITIAPNKEARTLTITDNGIGMDSAEVEANIGTIASSGTKAFLAALKEAANKPEMIGQFGVGFYAAFMVADRVEVVTRRAGRPAVHWVSSGDGEYEIGDTEREGRGTTVTLHLREGMEEFVDDWRIRTIVKHYSDYIAYPVVLLPDPTAKKEDEKKDDKESEDESETKEPQTLNSMKAIWKRGKDEIEAEELTTFYKHISHDFQDPLCSIQVAAEGATEFRALLFIPGAAPFDLFMGERKHGLQLYVRSVFIGDDIKELLPDYLRFVRGVVESSDLPLNVSREVLQDDAIVRRIRKTLVSRILGKFEELQKNKTDDYNKFYEAFGRVLKEGLHADYENAAKLKELVQFPSTFTEAGKLTTLKDYVSRMPSGQKEIYALSADTVDAARNSPMLEAFRARGYEVLFFVDPIDEWVVERLRDYDGKTIRAIDRGEIDLDGDAAGDAKKKDAEAEAGRFKPLTDVIKAKLADEIKDVRISHRLTESACCLVADEYGPNAHMERIMRAFNKDAGTSSKRVLELNPAHPLMDKLLAMAVADKEDAKLADFVELIHAQALLSEGSPIKNPTRFSKLLSTLMANA